MNKYYVAAGLTFVGCITGASYFFKKAVVLTVQEMDRNA